MTPELRAPPKTRRRDSYATVKSREPACVRGIPVQPPPEPRVVGAPCANRHSGDPKPAVHPEGSAGHRRGAVGQQEGEASATSEGSRKRPIGIRESRGAERAGSLQARRAMSVSVIRRD